MFYLKAYEIENKEKHNHKDKFAFLSFLTKCCGTQDRQYEFKPLTDNKGILTFKGSQEFIKSMSTTLPDLFPKYPGITVKLIKEIDN